MSITACKALACFSQYVDGFGIVHGDPDSSLKEARTPSIPDRALQQFIDADLVAAPKGWAKTPAPDPEPELVPVTDPGAEAKAELTALRNKYAEVTGGPPFMGWNAEELQGKIEAAEAAAAAADTGAGAP